MRLMLLIALGAGLVVLAGCRRSDDSSGEGSVEMDGDAIQIRTRDGTARIESHGTGKIETADGTMTFGESEVPEGFPLPLRPGAKVENSAHMTEPDGGEFFQVTCTMSGSAKELADYYEGVFKERGFEVTRTDQSGGGSVMIMVGGTSDEAEASAMVVRDAGAESPMVTLGWRTQKN